MTTNEIVVVGSVNLDLVVLAPRIPQPGETVLGSSLSYRAGGKGANQAVAAHRAGSTVTLFGAVGEDVFGRRLLDDVGSSGLCTDNVRIVPGATSGLAMIVVDPQAENTITVTAGANHALSPEMIDRELRDALRRAQVLILQGEVPLSTAAYAARLAVSARVRVVFNASPLGADDGPVLAELLRHTEVLVVNETEARQLGGEGVTAVELARSVLRTGCREVVVTLGGRGAVLATADDVVHIPAFDIHAIDTTGAGDAFCGVLASEIARGESTQNAIRVANAAGALAATVLGAQASSPTREQIDRLLREGALQDVR